MVRVMKTRSSFGRVMVGLFLAVPLSAQVVPATPQQFSTRSTGGVSTGSGGTDIGVKPGGQTPRPVVREISYISLSEARQWTSNDGRPLIGKIIAHEQQERVLQEGETTQAAVEPEFPKRPTVIRDGKVRLLIQQKPFDIPLERLSQEDQDFIMALDQAIAKQAASGEARQTETRASTSGQEK